MGSGLKKKKVGMGDYVPTTEEQKAMVWCIDNRVTKMSPKAAAQGNTNDKWHIDIWLNNKWNTSPETYGPVEIWEKMYEFYLYYYNKYKDEL